MEKTGRRIFLGWRTALLLAALTLLLTLAGCGSAESSQGTDETETTEAADVADETQESADNTVTIALWGNSLLENYAPWLQEQFPDVNFEFYVANNSTDYYRFRAEHDDLPDIMTVRRFSLRDVENLKEQLLDLSDTELANSFYQSYLRNYTYADGTVNWLPACAEIDDIIVNKTLFEENNIPLPTDYESFLYACEEFEKLGITGYTSDFAMDYTCMETLQGLSAAQLSSAEGRQWRQEYESGDTDTLSEEVWLPVFEKMADFIERAGVGETELTQSVRDIQQAFENGEVAMWRGTGDNLMNWGTNYERIMLPYPGDTEEDSWYLTYPAFQVAASAAASESAEREELILEIMTAMLSEEGLQHVSEGKNMLAYNKDVTLEMNEEFDNLQPYIEENRIYIRLASSDMFSISQSVVQGMINGELSDARAAFDEFNSQLSADKATESETVAHIDTGYSRSFDPDGGSEAASAFYNTLREMLDVDCVIGQSAILAGDILEGDYTEAEVAYLINGDTDYLLRLDLTGDELQTLIQYLLDVKGNRDSVTNDSTLPALSGGEMTVTKADGAYTLESLTIGGAAADADTTYSVVVRMGSSNGITELEEAGFTEYTILEEKAKGLLVERLVTDGAQLSEPTGYITLKAQS